MCYVYNADKIVLHKCGFCISNGENHNVHIQQFAIKFIAML